VNTTDTDAYSGGLRERSVDLRRRALQISDLRDTSQEGDLSEPVNSGDYGRIRHFTRTISIGCPATPARASTSETPMNDVIPLGP
jgi:hypothetical protein